MCVERLRFTEKDIKDEIFKIGTLITEYNDRKKENEDIPILSSTMSGIYLQNSYFTKNTASENTLGYKKVPRGYFTYRSMSDTGSYTFNIQNLVEIGIVSPAYPVFRSKNIDTKFFYYYLNNSNKFKSELLKSKQGGTRYALPVSLFKDLDVKIPPLEEQEKIGNFLLLFDRLIEKLETKIELLKELKKGYLQQMFPAKVEKVPRIRFVGFDGEWELTKLSSVATFNKGQGYSKSDLKNTGTPIILYGRLYTSYEIVISNVNTYATLKSKSILSKGGEVIVPASGESANQIAVSSVISKPGIIIGGDLNILSPSKDIHSIFLALSITYGMSHKEIEKTAQGKSVVHIQNSALKKIPVLRTSMSEQEKIGNFFKSLDSMIDKQENELNAIEQLKKGYMQRLFA